MVFHNSQPLIITIIIYIDLYNNIGDFIYEIYM